LFDNIPHTTSNGMNNNNEFQEFKLPLNKRNLKILDKEAPSDIGSKVSMASNKTSGGHVKRHCELCGFKHIADWVKHKKKVHGGIEVSSVKCLPECSYCTGKLTSLFFLANGNRGLQIADCKSRTDRQIADQSRTGKSRTDRQIADR